MASNSVVSPLTAGEVMSRLPEVAENETGAIRTIETWPSLAYFVSIGGAMSVMFLIGLALRLSGAEIVAGTAAAGGIVGGLLFTILEIGRHKHP